MSEMIVKLNSDRVKLNGCEYVQDLVRCGECKHAHLTYDGEVKYCDIWFPDEACYLKGNDFCSYGEKMERK